MDYRDKKTFHNSGLRSSLLARLIAVLMAVSMVVPYQSLAVYAVQNEPVAASEETADQAGASENQEEPGEASGQPAASEDKEDPKESPDQSEAAETRDSSEQASGDQKQEDAKTQNDNASGGNTVSEEGKQPSESSSPAKKASADDGSKEEGQPAGKETKDSPAGSSASEVADEYYKEPGGKAKTYTVTLTDDKEDTETVYAGDEVSYSVKVSMQAAATYKYDGQNSEPMFDQWKNIRIYLTLPENVDPRGIKQAGIADPNEPFIKVPGTQNTWQINLIRDYRDATNSNSINFDVVTRITGNGVLADGTVIDTATVEVAADFDVRILEDETQPDSYRTYSRDITSDPTEKITLSTPDEWVINKLSYKDPKKAYTISDDKKTVTVHYRLVYGLSVDGVPEDDKNVYFRHGRVPYDGEIYLTETPKLTLQDGTTTLEAKSITVTPEKGYVYNDAQHTSADDASGNAKPIKVTKDQAIKLPYAIVGDNEDEVDKYAPAYSQYDVDLVYDYEDFMVWFYEQGADPDAKAHSENTAKIDYTLLGQTAKSTDDKNTTDIPGYIPPGKITVKKFILNYMSGNKALYDSDIEYPVQGPAIYKIYKKNDDGTTEAAVIYEKTGENAYRQISGNTVTIDPGASQSATNGTDGTVSFYLVAGTYEVEEYKAPENTVINGTEAEKKKTITVNEGFEEAAEFENKERLGEVRVLKVDANNQPLSGADFQLYRDAQYTDPVTDRDGNTITKRTNKSEGYNASFERLPAGTYYLKEVKAPAGYLIPSEAIAPVTVDPDNPAGQVVKVTNQKNQGKVQLIKFYSTGTDPDTPIQVGAEDYKKFENAFVLQQSIDGAVWEDIDTYSIDDKGKTKVIDVPLYDDNGNAYQYRFKETVPDGFFGVGENVGSATRIVYSKSVTPAIDKDPIEMLNRKGGIIEVTKKTISVNTSQGAYEELEGGKKFDLYRVAAGATEAEKVASGETATSGADKGKVTFTGLESVTSDTPGKVYTYYIIETNPDSVHKWITDSTISVNGTDTPAVRVGSFTKDSGSTLTLDTYNIEQNVRIKIRKTDALNDGALVKGAKFKVYSDDSEQTIDNKNGEVYAEIELGKLYHIEETVAPVGYYRDERIQDKDTTTWRATVKDGKYVVVKKVEDQEVEVTEADLTFTFKDVPYQKLRLKKLQKRNNEEDTQATTLSGVTFSVYKKDP